MNTQSKKTEIEKLKVKKKVVKKNDNSKEATSIINTTPTLTWTIF